MSLRFFHTHCLKYGKHFSKNASHISNSEYEKILDSSTTEGKRLEAVLSKVADGLDQLKNEGVPVLFQLCSEQPLIAYPL